MEGLLLLSLGACYFRAELNTASDDSVVLNRDIEFLQIGTGIGLPNMSSKWAKLLEVPLCREVEVVVSTQESKHPAQIRGMPTETLTSMDLSPGLDRQRRGPSQRVRLIFW